MRLKLLSHIAAATALVAAPVAASAAPVANPAASLSVTKSARASATTEKNSQLFGGGVLATVIALGVIAIGVIAIVNDSEDSDSP
jgi:hypothetical protein